ncbi:MAG: hypothetical protein WA817_22580 [Candidatus Acidiferrum sp.]
MAGTRRGFLMTLVVAAICSVAADRSVFAQVRKNNPFPSPPQSAETENPAETAAAAAKSDSNKATKLALEQYEKVFREDVERLYQLASELKEEVGKTPTAEVFSVQMYRRAEAIEKLAKQLKVKAKG